MTLGTRTRDLALGLASTLLASAVAEGVVRGADGGTLPQVGGYVADGDGIALAPLTTRRIAGNPPWTLVTDEHGLRTAGPLPAGDGGWIVAGDSQVLGLGVAAEQTFVATLRARGVRAWPVGIPGYGVADALARAGALLGPLSADGVVVVVDEANDWTEATAPMTERYRVAGGWLLRPADADGARGAFLRSPLATSHLLFYLAQIGLHDWSRDPRSDRVADSPWGLPPAARAHASDRIASAIVAFSRSHPDIPTWVLRLPVDFETSSARAQRALPPGALDAITPKPWEVDPAWLEVVTALGDLPVLDPSPVLADPDAFLAADLHLSASGHAAVGALLAARLTPADPH